MRDMMLFTLIVCLIATVKAQSSVGAPPIESPAPAPGPAYVNISELLSVAGPFSTFLSLLEQTKVIQTFQNQANNTDEGITIFVPKDTAFKSLKNPSLTNLTADQLKSLCLFHALPHYYTLSDFKNLSTISPIRTFAGGELFSLNFTDKSGTVQLSSGWSNTRVSSSVYATDPIAIYQVDKVLLPEAIFGTDIPPTAAPAPAPDAESPDADTPEAASDTAPTTTSTPKSSSVRIFGDGILSYLIMAFGGGVMLFL